jgi:hypothetical protein
LCRPNGGASPHDESLWELEIAADLIAEMRAPRPRPPHLSTAAARPPRPCTMPRVHTTAGVEDLLKLQRLQRFWGASEHRGKCCVGEEDGAVLPDGWQGNGNPFEHHQRGHLRQGG